MQIVSIEKVANSLKLLRSLNVHRNFLMYLCVKRTFAKDHDLRNGAKVNFRDFFERFLTVRDAPLESLNKPYLIPFESSDAKLWFNRNVAGSFAPSSIRAENPINTAIKMEGSGSTVKYFLKINHAAQIYVNILNSKKIPVIALSSFLYRDFAFSESKMTTNKLIEVFQSEFGYINSNNQIVPDFNEIFYIEEQTSDDTIFSDFYTDEDINFSNKIPLLSIDRVRFLSINDLGIKPVLLPDLVPNAELSQLPYEPLSLPLQKIYFGAPGSGKSRQVRMDTEGMQIERTTFHPDTDYASFVGTYKPTLKADGNITYAFVPQIFTEAYVQAWNDLSKPVCLIIEEINRGNCAQIFGDLFQLLDRDSSTGFSTYPLTADTDLASHLAKAITDQATYVSYTGGPNKLKLPPNLLLYATMNTSDQSLFPMDSAFKRRWDWHYVPIDYDDARTISIQLGDKRYNWGTFLETINPLIYKLKGSEDKQLGNRFVDPPNQTISESQFRSKVLFYLWNDVWRDEHESGNSIFKERIESGDILAIETYGELFRGTVTEQTARLQRFMDANGVEPVPNDDSV